MSEYRAVVVATSWDCDGNYDGILWAQETHSIEETRSIILSDLLRLMREFDNNENEVRISIHDDSYGEMVIRAVYDNGSMIDYSCVFDMQG